MNNDNRNTKIDSKIAFIEIDSENKSLLIGLSQLLIYKDLFYMLALRDIRLRYKQAALGVLWVILQPLIPAIIFAVIFGNFARLPSQGVSYILFAFSGLVPWFFFSSMLSRAGQSLIGNTNIITKVYFPRIIVPLSSACAVFIDVLVGLLVFLVIMLYKGHYPTWNILALPIFLILSIIAAVGASLWISALSVKYRDFTHIMPFLIQIGMYMSPVVYSVTLIPEQWKTIYSLNPLVGIIEGFRWSLLGTNTLTWETLSISIFVSIILFLSGLKYFQKIERNMADII